MKARTPKEITAMATLIERGVIAPEKKTIYSKCKLAYTMQHTREIVFLFETTQHIYTQETEGTGWYSKFNRDIWTFNIEESYENKLKEVQGEEVEEVQGEEVQGEEVQEVEEVEEVQGEEEVEEVEEAKGMKRWIIDFSNGESQEIYRVKKPTRFAKSQEYEGCHVTRINLKYGPIRIGFFVADKLSYRFQ
jgi:hypothetical protein